MTSGLLVFLALLGGAVFLLSQALFVPAFGTDARMQRLLKRKLHDIGAFEAHSEVALLLRKKYLQNLSPLERRLESLPYMERLARFIEQSGRSILAHRLVGLAIIVALIAFLFTLAAYQRWLLAILAAGIAGAIPFVVIYRNRQARLAKFEEQLPDAVDIMKRALRAGHPFNSCLKLVADDMQPPIAREFELTFADVNYGNDLRQALLGMLLRVPSSNLMAVVTAVLIQKETGGNLAEIFDRISQVIRSRFRFGRRVRTLSAEGRLSAWILAWCRSRCSARSGSSRRIISHPCCMTRWGRSSSSAPACCWWWACSGCARSSALNCDAMETITGCSGPRWHRNPPDPDRPGCGCHGLPAVARRVTALHSVTVPCGVASGAWPARSSRSTRRSRRCCMHWNPSTSTCCRSGSTSAAG